MSAKNITTEKIDSSGFQSGGYKAPNGAGGKTTPKGTLINDLDHPGETGKARIKAGSEAGKESKNTNAYKGCDTMCDYSLEAIKSVEAQKGQTYTLGRFPGAFHGISGSKGFTVDDCGTVACMPEGMKLQLRGLTVDGAASDEVVEFIHLPVSWGYRDAVRFANGTEVSLQNLNEGCTASLYVELADKLGLDQIRADVPVEETAAV